ncbi:MAG: hypothetical protein GF331_02845, partial [Chitinivibrionales bacterium]|nr:hypothetical protein [Chitinivibrionales bacterium]
MSWKSPTRRHCRALVRGTTGILLALVLQTGAATLGSLQRGSASIIGGQSQTTVTISSVVKTQSFLLFSVAAAGNPSDFNVGGEITDATTLTFERFGTSGDVSIEWQVLEFSSGVTVQHGRLQRHGTGLAGDTTVPISSVDLGRSFATVTMSNSGSSLNNNEDATADITHADSLRIALSGGPDEADFFWQVVQFDGATVQKLTPSMGTADLTTTATLGTAVDPSRSMLIGNFRGPGAWAPSERPRAELTDGNTVTLTRDAGGSTADFVLYVVAFSDGSTVSRDTVRFDNGIGSRPVSIGAVDASRAAVVIPGHYGRQGTSDLASGDDPATGWFTVALSAANQITVTRAAAASNAVCPYEVVTFSAGGPTTRTWVGNSSTDWFVASNWSPNGIPGSQDTVIVDGSAAAHCILTGDVTIADLRQTGGTINTSDGVSHNLTTHHFSITGGMFDANNSVVTISGDCFLTSSADVFERGNS